MKTKLKQIGSLLALGLCAVGAHAAAFTTGNVVVSLYGDGSGALTSAAAAVSVLEYTPSGSLVQTVNIPSSGIGQLTGAGNSGTEDYITRSTDGTCLTFGGYDAAAGTAAIASTSAATVNRVVEKVDVNGNYSRVVTGTTAMYSGANIRSTVSDGVNYWMAGSSGGEWYSANGGTPVQISATAPSNARVIRIYNGNLYVSSGSSPNIGINAFSGIPTSSTTSPTLIVAAGTSPYDFAINPAGTVVYIADSSAGIQKWVYSGGSWTKKFTFGTVNGLTAAADSVAVDFSGPNPVIYSTTGESSSTPNTLRKITDTSALTATSSTDMATILATAPANTQFKGVTFAPTTSPVMISQPSDSLNNLVGSSFSLTVNTTTGGQALSYQWYSPDLNTPLVDGSYHGGIISGATTATLHFSSAAIAQSGNYQVIVTNLSGSITSRVAQVSVIANPVPPTIDSDITPIGSTNFVGDSVTFSVTAHGVPDVAYQWKWIPDTNNTVTNIIIGANNASLPLSNLTTNQSGKYFVTITNSTSYYTTNSSKAVLKVNPSPVLTVAQLRAMVDGSYNPTNTTSYYTIQGTVTTWTNLTTSSAPEFFVQDSSAGIMVYWANAGGSNCPPAGAVVKVTGPLTTFTGNLELHPDYNSPITGQGGGVQVISTGGPLPAAQALPFDPNVTGSVATMKILEGTYFVASNVTLLAGSTFASTSGGEQMTNNAYHIKTDGMYALQFTNDVGQTFTIYINSYVGIAGQPKPAGPVTVYGVLQEYYGAYEFTPTRYADIISYVHVTNVLTHARKGDLATNTYNELVLRPGETLNTHVSIGDAAGGTVTLTPLTDGLSANSSWSGIASGLNATGNFTFSPTSADAGSNYLVSLHVTSTTGTDYTKTFTVYVPTADEQQIAITEILANPTTNTAALHYNPLSRASAATGISTNDQYVEIANLSGTDWNGGSGTLFTLDTGMSSSPVFSSFDGNGADLPPTSSLVIYGGNGSPSVMPGLSTPVAVSRGLFLPNSGSGVMVLRNAGGYIIDRVAYSGSDECTNGSLTRFPTINCAFVPQNYVSTKHVTPGAQCDGCSWAAATPVPQGVSSVSVSVSNNQMFLNFTADTTKASTLWRADNLTDPFTVVNGGQFSSSAATFTETSIPSQRFYYITTQQ